MSKSYSRDIQLLISMLDNIDNIKNVIEFHKCNESNLDQNKMALDLCSFYVGQIGEALNMLTESTKSSFEVLDCALIRKYRNMISHVYERVDRKFLKACIFSLLNKEIIKDIKDRITYCRANREINNYGKKQ